MNASAILAIPSDQPERLFKHKDQLRDDYVALVKVWHPDVSVDPDANSVFAHIQALYAKAQDKVAHNAWAIFGFLDLVGRDGKPKRLAYRAKRSFELGDIYIGSKLVTFVCDRAHEKLVISGLRNIGTIRYPNEDFRRSLEAYFPKVEHYVDTSDKIVICMRKEESEVLISDLLKHQGGQMDPKHVAWIMSSLFNLACFLELNKMCVNGISINSAFVSPKKHSVSLYGGWWYAAEFGKNISSLPPDVYKLASRKMLIDKKADPFLDLESIRAIGRACLGDISGNTFRMRDDIPKAMASFLQLPSSKSALKDYEGWVKVLEDSFGPRKFIKLDVGFDDVYPKEDF